MNDEDEFLIYGHTVARSRCITSVLGDDSTHKFLVGTGTLHSENFIHLFEYSNEDKEFSNINIFPHKYEIWDITSSPSNADLFFCIYNNTKNFDCSLYKINETPNDEKLQIEKTFSFSDDTKHKPLGDYKSVLWDNNRNCVSVSTKEVCDWDIEKKTCISSLHKGERKIYVGVNDPNDKNIIGIAENEDVKFIDKRKDTKKPPITIKKAHQFGTRCLDFNPIALNTIVTGGEDCKMRFWDIRNTKSPLLMVCAHSHWVVQTKYNPMKDQLLLSSSTDGLVKLWNISTVSSLRKNNDEKKRSQLSNRLLQSIKEYESVYSVSWSSFDSWVFASVSYNGRVSMHQVPFLEKDMILSGIEE